MTNSITINYAAQIKRAAGVASDRVELAAPCTLQDLILHVADRYGNEFKSLVLDPDGKLHASILVFVGDRQVRWEDDGALADGDAVTLMSPISGG